MVRILGACLALAALSLLLPSELGYDPLAWVVWGREVVHFALDTTGGPSWKPLPVVFTALVAPLGELDRDLPPMLWMVVARAGGLLAPAMAFRLASRLGGGGWAGALGGALAAGALVLTPDWFQFVAHGSEAPLAVALMLWAVERHLDGRPEHAIVLGALAGLLRPELVGDDRGRLSGNPRYVLPALALACVLAGVGAANLVDAGGGFARRRSGLSAPAGAGLAVAAVALLAGSLVVARTDGLANEVREVGERMNVHRDLSRAVAAEGVRQPSRPSARPPPTAPCIRVWPGSSAGRWGRWRAWPTTAWCSARPEKSWLGASTGAAAPTPASRSAGWAAS